jgi:hypothetical protein
MKKVTFLLLTFLSSFGDTLFLAGVPLYLYSKTNSVSYSFLVPIVITITLLVVRTFAKKFQNYDSLSLVGIGEFSMFAIEIGIIFIHYFLQSPWVIIIGLIPLAAVYNVYAAAKFMALPS